MTRPPGETTSSRRWAVLRRAARHALVLGGVLWALAAPAAAQLPLGDLLGSVGDAQGAPIPQVHIRLEGTGGTRQVDSDAKGLFQVLALPAGGYRLTAARDGLATAVHDSLEILAGRPTTVRVRMSPVPAETLVVTAEPPQAELGAAPTALVVTSRELDRIPTARDPWAIAARAPGVLSTAVDVAGSDGGEQPTLAGPGAAPRENAYSLDGAVLTDMEAVGSTPVYFDLDQMSEVRVSAGGARASTGVPGVLIELVSKRGEDELRGSARWLLAEGGWLSHGAPPASLFPEGQPRESPSTIDRLAEYGAEAGTRLVRDRLWGWAAAGRSEIDLDRAGGVAASTRLDNLALRLDAQPGQRHTLALQMRRFEKVADGIGAGPTRAPATVQREHGPALLIAASGGQMLGSGAYLDGLAAWLDTRFAVDPAGGRQARPRLDPEGIWQGTYDTARESRDSVQAGVDGGLLLGGERRSHALAFGASWRRFRVDSRDDWGADNLLEYDPGGFSGPGTLVEARRSARNRVDQSYGALWVQDAWQVGAVTAQLGLRYDDQRGRTLGVHLPANAFFADLLPALDLAASRRVAWRTWSPRLGIAWALGARGTSVLRASYGRYPAQLASLIAQNASPEAGAAGLSALYRFSDLDGDGHYDPGEPTALLSTSGVDPAFLADPRSADRTDPRLSPEITDELTLGWEHELRPEPVTAVHATYRRIAHVLEQRRLVRDLDGNVRAAERTDYVFWRRLNGTLPDGQSYDVPVYTLDNRWVEYTGGRVLVNGDREQRYLGATVEATRRLKDGWALRGQLTWSDWRWHLGPDFRRHDEPTDAAAVLDTNGFGEAGDSENDVVAPQDRGRRSGVFLNSPWALDVAGSCQVAPSRRWGFDVALAISGRRGYPEPYRTQTVPADGLPRTVQLTERTDTQRLDDLWLVDLRLEKQWAWQEWAVVLGLDVFNLFDRRTELERTLAVDSGRSGWLVEAVAPRTLRLGVRLRLR